MNIVVRTHAPSRAWTALLSLGVIAIVVFTGLPAHGAGAPRGSGLAPVATTSTPKTPPGWKTPYAPDNLDPQAGTTFNHPFISNKRYQIRTKVIRAINSTPTGGYIRVASWSFRSTIIAHYLWLAHRRGVNVEVIVSGRNNGSNSNYPALARFLGTNTARGSWVHRCYASCRGRSGTMHSKIFLFSKVHNTSYVTMTGSANLTDMAAEGQWNQMDTAINQQNYLDARDIFFQMRRDRPAGRQYVVKSEAAGQMYMYYYPQPGARATDDQMYQALNNVRCSSPINGYNGHTIIKIAMYAWYENRGLWLAKKVRSLHDQGCVIQIIFAVMASPERAILSPIPMRQTVTLNAQHYATSYLHQKYVAINGTVVTNSGVPNPMAYYVYQGSFNFSDLGFTSDEQTQRLQGRTNYTQYANDFKLTWSERMSKPPGYYPPIQGGRTGPEKIVLGQGTYQGFSND